MLCCIVIDIEGDADDDKKSVANVEVNIQEQTGDEDDDGSALNRMESISSAMELAQPDQEELIYEGDDDEELPPTQEKDDTDMDLDTGSEVIFDLAQEVDMQLDTTADNEQDTSLTSDGNSAGGGGGNAKGKTSSGEGGSRFVCICVYFAGAGFVCTFSTGHYT